MNRLLQFGALVLAIALVFFGELGGDRLSVETRTHGTVACPYGITVTPDYERAPAALAAPAVLCAYAVKDGGFLYRGFRLAEVAMIRAR